MTKNIEDYDEARAKKLAVHLRETIDIYYKEMPEEEFPVGEILMALSALSGTLVAALPGPLRQGAAYFSLEVFASASGGVMKPMLPEGESETRTLQ